MARVVWLAFLAACGGGSAPPPPSPSNTGGSSEVAPDLAGLRGLLVPVERLPFDAAARLRGCPDETLGAYLALLVREGTDAGGADEPHHLTGGCGAFPPEAKRIPLDPPEDAAYWYCVLDAYRSDPAGESPWHYELRVRVRRSDRAPDLATIACPGSA